MPNAPNSEKEKVLFFLNFTIHPMYSSSVQDTHTQISLLTPIQKLLYPPISTGVLKTTAPPCNGREEPEETSHVARSWAWGGPA